VFILATTEPHKLPATIISRCQRFDFKRLSTQDILERMKVVLEDINLPFEEQALKVIAQSAAGGMRDALSLLDQVVSFSNDIVRAEDALLVTGSVSQDVFYDMSQALLEKDVAKVLSLVEELIANGKEPLRLAEDLITFFRDLLLLQTGEDLVELLQLVAPEEQFIELAKNYSADTLYGFIDILAKTQQEMRFSHQTKIYLETALLKMTQHQSVGTATIDPAIQSKVGALENMVRQLTQQLQEGGAPIAATQPKQERTRVKSPNGFKAPIGRIHEVLKTATKGDIQKIKSAWAQALAPLPKSQTALLNDAEPVAASSNAFVVKFKYDIHCQMVAENREFTSIFTQNLAAQLSTMYEMLCIPEGQWLTLREEFIRDNGLNQKKQEQADMVQESGPFIEDATPVASQDPIVVEAENLFGKDFVEVVED